MVRHILRRYSALRSVVKLTNGTYCRYRTKCFTSSSSRGIRWQCFTRGITSVT